jgi:hypothetical protein
MVLCSLLSRITSQELQVKNCKKSLLDSLDIFSCGLMNERIFSLVKMVGYVLLRPLRPELDRQDVEASSREDTPLSSR